MVKYSRNEVKACKSRNYINWYEYKTMAKGKRREEQRKMKNNRCPMKDKEMKTKESMRKKKMKHKKEGRKKGTRERGRKKERKNVS